MPRYARKFVIITFVFISFLLSLIGCGGGGSSNADNGPVQASFCRGKLSFENADSENILFASAKGSGVTGGWIENQAGTKIGENLKYKTAASAYETMIRQKVNPLNEGSYTFKYYVGSEEFSIKKDLLSWVGTPDFQTAPTPPTWDSSFRNLSVSLPAVSGGSASYYVRLYYAVSPDTLYDQSQPQSGGLITMQVNVADDYLVMLVADIIENDQVVATTRHVFSAMALK